MDDPSASDLIEQALGTRPRTVVALAGGCIAEVYRAAMPDGQTFAVKIDRSPTPRLDVEGMMLRVLGSRVRVPRVVRESASVLVLEFIESAGGPSDAGREDLADAVARLHADEVGSYGFECPTLIGPLVQVNPVTEDWAALYRDHRLMCMARSAAHHGSIGPGLLRRIESLAARLPDFLGHAEPPVLIHGDLWSGNVLWHRGRLAALIDPAIYWADREVELAFMDLMGGFGQGFWSAYHERKPIRDGFWEQRRPIYHLYPLLVHARLFGGQYPHAVASTLATLGF